MNRILLVSTVLILMFILMSLTYYVPYGIAAISGYSSIDRTTDPDISDVKKNKDTVVRRRRIGNDVGGLYDMGAYVDQADVALKVYVNIKSIFGSNELHLRSRGMLRVVIFGSEHFDVTTINARTILLGRGDIEGKVSPVGWYYSDVRIRNPGKPYKYRNFTGDAYNDNNGYNDLVFLFKTQELVRTLKLKECYEKAVSHHLIPFWRLTITGNLKEEYGKLSIEGENNCLLSLWHFH